MAVRDDWQNKGVGSALMQAVLELADRWLNLTRLELEVYTDNVPAIRLYEKFGVVREGTHRQYAFRDGIFVNAYAMGRGFGVWARASLPNPDVPPVIDRVAYADPPKHPATPFWSGARRWHCQSLCPHRRFERFR